MGTLNFYKDSTHGYFVVGNHIVPQGLYVMNVASDNLSISIRDTSKALIFDTILVTSILKENGSAYTNLAELLAATKDFFFRVTVKPQTYQALVSATNVTPFNTNLGVNGKITLTEDTTITLSNLVSGDEGNIKIIQDAANYTVAISPTPKVSNGGSGAIVITAGAGSITVLSYSYDGTDLLVTYSPDWT